MNVITSPFLVFTRRWLAGWLAPFLSSYNIGLLSSLPSASPLHTRPCCCVFPGSRESKRDCVCTGSKLHAALGHDFSGGLS